jgi:hypothetical protein
MSDLKYWIRTEPALFAFRVEYMVSVNRPAGYQRYFHVGISGYNDRIFISIDESSPTIPLDALIELVEALKVELQGSAE